MSADNENQESNENRESNAYDGMDALMAAILDEPLPEDARADGALIAEHRSAMADVALLREQLAIIGDALADPSVEEPEPEPAPEPVVVRVRRSRALRRGFATVCGLAAAGAVVSGLGWLMATGGSGAMSSSDSDSGSSADKGTVSGGSPEAAMQDGRANYLACARLVAEGTVTDVEQVPGTAQDRVTLHITHFYKPETGKDEVVFVMPEELARFDEGDKALIGLPRRSATPDVWAIGEKDIATERKWIVRALPQSRSMTCD